MKEIKLRLEKHFKKMCEGNKMLFKTDVSKDQLWETYLKSFPEGYNDIYKERRFHDCNACKTFIRTAGNVVEVKDGKLISIWDMQGLVTPWKEVAAKMSELIKSAPIRGVFLTPFRKMGISSNHQLLEDGTSKEWEHLFLELPSGSVCLGNKDTLGSELGKYETTKGVFKRSLEELTLEAVDTIIELVEQDTLYRGAEYIHTLTNFKKEKLAYAEIPAEEKDNWVWVRSINNPVAKIRNTAIGTLLIDISKGVDLDSAVKKWESVMAPTNYKRPKAIFTKKMVEDAEIKLKEMGFENSLERKFAVLGDITVNNVLHVNRDTKPKLGTSVFDDLKGTVDTKKPGKTPVGNTVGIEDFISDILPKATEIEMLVENRHKGNLVSLIAPKNKEAKCMLKWDNNFSWAYTGDITDSMKQRVKAAGGNVKGELRFSIQWNDGDNNQNDFDAHCKEPTGGTYISFSCKGSRQKSSGMLDVDIVNPGNKVAVENITYSDRNKMPIGPYEFLVHNFSHNGGRTGFTAQIEFDGQILEFEYPHELKQSEKVSVATVNKDKDGNFTLVKSLDHALSCKEIWGIKTNTFTKVEVMMFSPNYWDGQKGIGNKHYFFMLEGCKSDVCPRGFFNEFLNPALNENKKVFEALGSRMRVEMSDEQLSGIGFSSTVRNEVQLKVDGKLFIVKV